MHTRPPYIPEHLCYGPGSCKPVPSGPDNWSPKSPHLALLSKRQTCRLAPVSTPKLWSSHTESPAHSRNQIKQQQDVTRKQCAPKNILPWTQPRAMNHTSSLWLIENGRLGLAVLQWREGRHAEGPAGFLKETGAHGPSSSLLDQQTSGLPVHRPRDAFLREEAYVSQ